MLERLHQVLFDVNMKKKKMQAVAGHFISQTFMLSERKNR